MVQPCNTVETAKLLINNFCLYRRAWKMVIYSKTEKKPKQEQLLFVYIGPKQWICRIYTAVELVLLNDFGPRGHKACLRLPTAQSKRSDLEPLPNAQPRPQKWIQSQLPRRKRSRRPSPSVSTMTHLGSGLSASLPLTESERDEPAS